MARIPDPATSEAIEEAPASPRRLGPGYLKLWLASGVSNLGDGVRLTALPLLAATITRDPGLVAGVSLAGGLPWALFALPAGALVDRWDRKRIMWIANAMRFGLMLALAILVLGDGAGIPVIYAISFLLGVAEVMFDNAAQAIMPRIVAKDDLEKANGRLYAVELVSNQFVGPPLGGFLFAAAVAAPFFVDAATFAVSALLIAAIAGDYRVPRGEGSRLRTEIVEGLRWLWAHRLLRFFAFAVGVSNLVYTAVFSIFVLFALEILDLGSVGFGVLMTAMALGSLAGSLLTPRVVARIGSGPALFLTAASSTVTILVVGLTSSPFVVAAMQFIEGFVIVMWNVITVSLRQQVVPERLLGRVNSAYRLMAWGTMPVGAALGGVLASIAGLRAPFYVGSALLALLALQVARIASSSAIEEARSQAG